jgi:hypothetical protein
MTNHDPSQTTTIVVGASRGLGRGIATAIANHSAGSSRTKLAPWPGLDSALIVPVGGRAGPPTAPRGPLTSAKGALSVQEAPLDIKST